MTLEDLWPLITVAVLALAKLANSKTKHWRDWPWYGKVLGLALEVLDLWRPPSIKKQK